MVAKINTPHRLLTALNYNEKKVVEGKAECIYAGNYLQEANRMNFYQKFVRLENQNRLNDRAQTKTVHISLNFDVKENLSKEKLIAIANEYMERIGFQGQPFLVYKHNDAAHPHIHIVASTIRNDGSRINTHNLGRNQSEKARKEIEMMFHLIKAENKKNKTYLPTPVDLNKMEYGKAETKKSLSSIITHVMNTYNYSSLAEFNAVLKQYNITTDRGREESIIYKTGGLMYRIIDADNNRLGVPIKASSIFSKPTLGKLQKRFDINQVSRDLFRIKIKSVIDEEIAKNPKDINHLMSLLTAKQIYTLVRHNSEGRMYGITFVDNVNKSVFNGSDIGKNYSINGLQKSFVNGSLGDRNNHNNIQDINLSQVKQNTETVKDIMPSGKVYKENDILHDLLSSGTRNQNVPAAFKRKKRKKKKNSET